jgi:hypothetical protein
VAAAVAVAVTAVVTAVAAAEIGAIAVRVTDAEHLERKRKRLRPVRSRFHFVGFCRTARMRRGAKSS